MESKRSNEEKGMRPNPDLRLYSHTLALEAEATYPNCRSLSRMHASHCEMPPLITMISITTMQRAPVLRRVHNPMSQYAQFLNATPIPIPIPSPVVTAVSTVKMRIVPISCGR